MASLLGGLQAKTEEILFLNEVLRQYREVRKVYHYEYTDEDKEALQHCATDLRPFSYSFAPATAAYWVSGKFVKTSTSLSRMTRASLLLLRLAATAEVFRFGYLVGSYRQGMDCTRRLVSLQSPLGGEVAAIIRERDPEHPLLRFERPPIELNEDGSRSRIMAEPNRLAQIARLQRELSQARAGQVVDRSNERADERLFQIMRHREEVLGEIHRGGGPTAAASSGSLEALQPAQPPSYTAEYGATTATAGGSGGVASASARTVGSGGGGGGSSTVVSRGGGLVITDHPAHPAQQGEEQQRGGAAAGLASTLAQAGTEKGGEVVGDPMHLLLGGGGSGGSLFGDELSEEQRRRVEEEQARQERRQRRRSRWWRRHSGHGDESTAG